MCVGAVTTEKLGKLLSNGCCTADLLAFHLMSDNVLKNIESPSFKFSRVSGDQCNLGTSIC